MDGVRRWKPGGARVLLGAEGPVEGLGDGTQVEGAHRRCCDAVALWRDGYGRQERGESDRRGWRKREGEGEKNKSREIIPTIILIAVYMLAVNVQPYQESAAGSCVIKPYCNVLHPLNGSPIIYTCTKHTPCCWLALAAG